MKINFCFFFFIAVAILNTSPLISSSVVLVTGGAQGIGKAIAEKFGSNGAQVIIIDINDKEGKETAAHLRKKGMNVIFYHCDVSSESDVEELFHTIINEYKAVDVCVNNAAIAIYKNAEEYMPQEWDQIIGVNLRGIYLVARHMLPMMKKERKGSFISIASVHSRTTSKKNAPYVATKGAVVSLTRALALECAPYNVRVNCVSPGAIETPMLMGNWGDVAPSEHPLVPKIPLERIGKPEEVANVIYFLASDEASYMTGSEVLVDGGLSAHFD